MKDENLGTCKNAEVLYKHHPDLYEKYKNEVRTRCDLKNGKNSDSIDGIEGGQNGEWQEVGVEIVREKDDSDEFGEEELEFFDELMMLYA